MSLEASQANAMARRASRTVLLGLPICLHVPHSDVASILLPDGGNRRHARECDIRPALTPQSPPPDRLEILGRHICMDATLVMAADCGDLCAPPDALGAMI
jgi:hypothetical protein